ncbi:MAG: polymorphic toxin-type HINT domain-containing protein [Ancrocorticia sp.]
MHALARESKFKAYLHRGLDAMGMVPVVGEAADGTNAVLYAIEGDWKNAAISVAAMVPIIGNAATGGRLLKNTFRQVSNAGEAISGWVQKIVKRGDGASHPCMNSFTGVTLVLMADGTQKPIQDVAIGDQVMATDPETGEKGPRTVEALIRNTGPHTMVAVGTDQDTIDATDNHPFWVESRGEWVEAIALQPGDILLDEHGNDILVTELAITEQDLTAYNLTIEDIHTYYAGTQPTLVHNCPGGVGPVNAGKNGEKRVREAYDIGGKQKISINNRNRIPDGITPETLSEVKNVKSQSLSRQLRDDIQYAKDNNLSVDLYTRSNTYITGPLQTAISNGDVTRKFIP